MAIIEYNADKDLYWSFHIAALKLDNINENTNIHSILIVRQGALGDVLLMTSFFPVLKASYSQAIIHIRTDAGEALLHNPYVDRIIPYHSSLDFKDYDLVIDLDLSYEREPLVHIVDIYKNYFGVEPLSEKPQIFPSAEDMKYSERITETIGNFAVFDVGNTWPSRMWPISHYKTLAKLLYGIGIKIVELGITDETTGLGYDLTNKTSIHQAAALISQCLFFVGPDSLLGHIAQAFEKPAFLFFGPILPETRIWRNTPSVNPLFNRELTCLGCHQHLPSPVTYSTCHRSDNYCMKSINPEEVFKKIMDFKIV